MVSEQESIAMAEVIYYLRGIRQEDVDKIPQKFVDYLFDNASKEHKCDFDNSLPLNDINVLDETRGIIGTICYNYWCENEDQKKEYLDHLSHNEQIKQEELNEKYNPDNSIHNDNTSEQANKSDSTESLVDTQKLKWYQKISNYFSNIFKKKK